MRDNGLDICQDFLYEECLKKQVSVDEIGGLKETEYLLSNPRNAERLLRVLDNIEKSDKKYDD